MLKTYGTGTLIWAPLYSGASATTTFSLSNAVETTASYTSTTHDTDSYWSSSPNPERLTAPTTGYYAIEIYYQRNWTTSDSGNYLKLFFYNGSTTNQIGYYARYRNPITSAHIRLFPILYMTAGNYVYCKVYQSSGSAFSVSVTTTIT